MAGANRRNRLRGLFLKVYLDHHATTPVDARVLETMLPYFCANFGNAASGHAWGHEAAQAMSRQARLRGSFPCVRSPNRSPSIERE